MGNLPWLMSGPFLSSKECMSAFMPAPGRLDPGWSTGKMAGRHSWVGQKQGTQITAQPRMMTGKLVANVVSPSAESGASI